MNSAQQKCNIVRHSSRTQRIAAALKKQALGLFLVLIILTPILYTRLGTPTRVYAAASKELNFQARLLTGTGAIVADGNYSVQFNLYNVASGGTTQWTETQGTVAIRSGYLSVYLGAVTPFPSTIDWSQQQWLTMNVNGDGEMTPRLKLTAVPNALHANEADALRSGSNLLTADNFAQLAPTTPQVINSALAALRLNQTGAGLLAQLQNNGSDVFTIANNGNVTSSGSATFSGGTLTLGSGTQLAGLVLNDGAGKTGLLKPTTLAANRTYTLPDADGIVCLTTTCPGASGGFINGGNTFAGAATLGTNDNFSLSFRTNNTNQLTLDTSGNLNFLTGGLQVAGTTVLTSGRVLQNVTADTGILTTGTLGVARGGTGVNASAATNGQLLIGNGTGFTLGTLANNGGLTITNTAGGIGLAVNYGSTATTAVRGDTGLVCPSGTGNLSGTGNTITLGTGGTCNALDTKAAVSFATSVTTPILTNAGSLTISTTGANDLTLTSGSGLLVLNTSTVRRTAAGITTFDFADAANTTLALTNSGTGVLNLTVDGSGSFGTGLSVLAGGASITGNTSVAGGTFTSSGGLISLNDGSNFGTKINTGLSNGTVTIGGGSAPLVIDSTAFDVSAAGALSGISTIGLSGAISGGTTYSGSGVINTTGGAIQTNSTDRVANNGDLVNIGNITGTGAVNVSSTGAGNALTLTSGSGVIQLAAGTLKRTSGSLIIDVNNAGSSTLTVTNSDASNVANLSVEGAITAGTNSAFSVNGNGDITGVMNQLDGTTTTNGTSGLTPPSTSLTLTNATNFDVGNYVQVNDANCGGTGVNPCYAKITAKVGNVLTISPGLTWTSAKTVNEFHIPEIGGTDTSQALANRYGRGYFISGVAVGNGTTYYNEDSISSSLASFDLLSGVTGTLNVGVGANKITLGGSSTTTTFAGNVNFTGTLSGAGPTTGTSGYLQRSGTVLSPATGGDSLTTAGNISTSGSGTITAAAGLTVQGGGASITGNSSVTGTLGVSSTLTVSSGGASVTGGLSLLTGALNLTSGGITNTGALAGVTTITANNLVASVGLNAGTGLIQNTGGLTSIGSISLNDTAGINTTNIGTGTTTGQITIGGGSTPLVINSTNFKVSSAGALSGITTIGLSGAITGATTGNTINGLVINSGALSAITGITFTSGGLNLNSGGITNGGAFSGLTTLGLSGAITGATAGNTINGLVISSGALSGITGITFTSGSLNLASGGITNAGSLTGVGANITGTGALTVSSGGAGNLILDAASNIVQIAASDTTLQRSAAGTYTVDLLNSGAATTLSVSNSDATQVANLSVEGSVSIGAGQTYSVGASQISSANLSNDANLAKLNGTGPQTFTGNNKFTGTVLNTNTSATAFMVQNAGSTATVLGLDTTANSSNVINANASFEIGLTNWTARTGCTLTQINTQAVYGANSGQCVNTATAGAGAKYAIALTSGTQYTFSVFAKASGANFATFEMGYSHNGSTDTSCLSGKTVTISGWTRYSCTFTVVAGATASSYVYVDQTDATARTWWIDAAQLVAGANTGVYREGQITSDASFKSALTLQPLNDSSTALLVTNAAGKYVLSVDTVTNTVELNAGLDLNGIVAPAVSDSGQARVYYDTTLQRLQISTNGGNYQEVGDASVARISTLCGSNSTIDVSIFKGNGSGCANNSYTIPGNTVASLPGKTYGFLVSGFASFGANQNATFTLKYNGSVLTGCTFVSNGPTTGGSGPWTLIASVTFLTSTQASCAMTFTQTYNQTGLTDILKMASSGAAPITVVTTGNAVIDCSFKVSNTGTTFTPTSGVLIVQ